ncbi:probable crinkler effector protein 15 [Coccomyxa sp. Obi]|nr:probable crinkler effector protein 15 [Coccomyxa sp. Obi]
MSARMDAAKKLRELSQEVAKATADVWDAYSREKDPQLAAALKAKWEELARKSEALRVAALSVEENAIGVQPTVPGATLDGGKGSFDTDLSDRSRFARWAANAGEEDEDNPWLELPEGVYFLGRQTLGRCLYVRDAYRKLADKVEALQAAGRPHVVISGNPGLGTTWFAIWMLIRWLRKGKHVLWQTSRNKFYYYRDGMVSQLSEDEADDIVLSNRELYYIADGAMPLVDLEVKQSLVAHSPDDSKYKEYLKIDNAASSPLYMPFWDEEELELVRLNLHPDVSRNQMNQAIARRGEVPRYVLGKGADDQMDLWIEAAVSNLTWEDIIRAVPGSARASHRIAGIHPKDWLARKPHLQCMCRNGNFAQYKLSFLSVAVKDLVAMRMTEVVTGGLANLMFLVNKSANALAADLGSCIEESIVHALLKQGGRWPLRKCAPRYSRGPVASQKSAKKQVNSSSISASSLQAANSKSEDEGIVRGSASTAGDQEESRDLAERSELSDQSGIMGGSSNSGDSSGPRE